MSEERCRGFERRGFSKLQLCVAMTLFLRFDPESGERLMTYSSVEYPEGGELPLTLPDCFKNGAVKRSTRDDYTYYTLDLSKCNLVYNPITGNRLSERDRSKLLTFGLEQSFEGGCGPGGGGFRPIDPAEIRNTSSNIGRLQDILDRK
jgi:hypothetical protein